MQELFSNCGFDTKESQILTFLAHHSTSSAGIISKQLNIKRPTVYAILDRLIRLDIIISWKERGSTLYQIKNLAELPKQISLHAKNTFTKTVLSANTLAKELTNLASTNKTKNIAGFKVSTIDTVSGTLEQLEAALSSGELCGIFNPELTFKENGKDVVRKFLKKTAISKPKIRDLIVPCKEANLYRSMVKNPNHVVRDLPKGYLIETDFVISNNSVSFYHYYDKSWSAIKIEQAELYRSFLGMFEMLWVMSGK